MSLIRKRQNYLESGKRPQLLLLSTVALVPPPKSTASGRWNKQLRNILFERLAILIAQDWNVASSRFQPLYINRQCKGVRIRSTRKQIESVNIDLPAGQGGVGTNSEWMDELVWL